VARKMISDSDANADNPICTHCRREVALFMIQVNYPWRSGRHANPRFPVCRICKDLAIQESNVDVVG
jgi:hypothetical protein